MSTGEILLSGTGERFSRKYLPISTPSEVYSSEACSTLGSSSSARLGDLPNRNRKLVLTSTGYTRNSTTATPNSTHAHCTRRRGQRRRGRAGGGGDDGGGVGGEETAMQERGKKAGPQPRRAETQIYRHRPPAGTAGPRARPNAPQQVPAAGATASAVPARPGPIN